MLYFEDFQIGDARTAGDYEMREEEIIAFAQQWDPQPWHVDPEAAARSPMQGIMASSCHTYAVAARLLNRRSAVACRNMLPDRRFVADCLRESFTELTAAAAAKAEAASARRG